MTADFHKFDGITVTEKAHTFDQKLAKDPMNAQLSELRESDPKGYIANLKQMDSAGQNAKAYPQLELFGTGEDAKKQALLKDQEGKHTAETKNGADHAKHFAEGDGATKLERPGKLQDLSVKDMEIKIKLEVSSSLTKTQDVTLPNYTIHDRET